MNRYNYKELETAALENPTAENLAALGEWFEWYGVDFWNGEYFEIDSSNRLYPVYKEVKPDEWERIGWEIRQ